MEVIYKIKGVEFSQEEIEQVVNFWYLSGMYPSVLQDEDGWDLEAILDCQSELDVQIIKNK